MSFWRDIRNGARLEDTTCPETLARPCLGPNGWIVGRSGSTARVWKFEGTWRVMTENCVTAWAGAIDYQGRAIWVENGVGVVREKPGAVPPYEKLPVEYQSEGIYDVQPMGAVIMAHGAGSSENFTREDGSLYLITSACIRGDFIAGYANSAPTGIVAGQLSTGKMWQVWEGDPMSLPIRLDDDGQTVAVSGPAGGFIPFSAWTVLKPTPPDYPVVPLTKPTLFGVFAHQSFPFPSSWVNAWTSVNPADPQIVAGKTADNQTVIWNRFDLESMTGDRTSPCVYIGSPQMILDAHLPRNSSDILSPWCYPEPNETPDQFRTKAQVMFDEIVFQYGGMTVAPVWRVDTRIGPNGPTLTEAQVLKCLSIASTEFPGLPALFFQGDRAGFVSSAVPMLEKWRNGQPCSVPIQPVPPPPVNNNATLRRRLTMPYPPLAGFRKTQFTKDPSNGNYLNLAVQNPIAVAYDGGPAVGTVLRNARTGQPMPQGLALVCLDRAGNWTGMPTDTVGIGWFGFWSITGNLAYICPRNQDGTNDQSFTFIVVD